MAFVFVTYISDTCGYCTRFKESGQFTLLLKKLSETHPPITVIELNNQNNYGKGGTPYVHPRLYDSMRWFPSFALVNYNDWMNKETKTLKVSVYGAEMVAGMPKWTNTRNMTVQDIMDWVADETSKINRVLVDGHEKTIKLSPKPTPDSVNNNSFFVGKIKYKGWVDGDLYF